MVLISLGLGFRTGAAGPSAPEAEKPPPSTPREFYNAGTQKLAEGKLREAEAMLESVLAAQVDRLQPPTLYNLGHVRFLQGVEELKKGPAGGPAAARGRTAAQSAAEVIHAADEALVSNDVQRMVASYLNGRGARRELKAATQAVKRALQAHGVALGKWQRAAGDFKSTVELKPDDAEAQKNAEIVERCIAKLVDSIQELQQAAAAMGQMKKELGDKMKELQGRIPEPDMPPGAPGDDEEEEDMPNGPKPGEKEGPTKEGEEMSLSPEQASWLLEGFKLDSERRLPMGQQDTTEPKERSRKTW